MQPGRRNTQNSQHKLDLAAKVDLVDKRNETLHLCLLPLNTKHDLHVWRRLHQEIRRFRRTGLLVPINKTHLGDDEHFQNTSIDPIRILPRPLYDRITRLPASTKNMLFPRTGGRWSIRVKDAMVKRAWLGDTEYTRRRYDRWYWDMRLKRIPFTVALRKPMKTMISNIQRKLHFHHTSAAVERNRLLKWPPRWLEEVYLDEC